jgi:phospho-N-acetylmuramoyl-pentapeptide-transferase
VTWTVLVSLSLLPLSAVACYGYVRWMRACAFGQQIRACGPQLHHTKAGTPTAGGTVILLLWGTAIVVLGLLRGWPAHAGFVVACGLGFGSLGLLDDLLSYCRRQSDGLTGGQKILGGTLIALAVISTHREILLVPQTIPFSDLRLLLPASGAALLCWMVLLSTTNSANLTDGLDGLAGGVSLLSLGGLLVLSPQPDTVVLILPLLSILIGFLWLNVYPARLFLGDIGSFGLGGALGALAWIHGAALLLPLLAGLFVLEASSVMLQLVTLRLTGRRLLKMAPLHHHFEDSRRGQDCLHWIPGARWPEMTVTARFLLLQAGFVLLAFWAGGVFG